MITLLLFAAMWQGPIERRLNCELDKPTPEEISCPQDYRCKAAKPEPRDVPAIHHEDTRFFYCGQGGPRCDHGEHSDKPESSNSFCSYDSAAAKLEASCGKDYWTCADKTRILEHDEQNPPRWWCRKVEP